MTEQALGSVADSPRVVVDFPIYDLKITTDEYTIRATYDRTDQGAAGINDPNSAAFYKSAMHIRLSADIIANNPDAFALLDFHQHTEGRKIEVTAATNPRLNERRQQLAWIAGINTGTIVEYPGNFVEFDEFGGHLAVREIPRAIGEEEIAHDNLVHRLGDAVMCSPIFERFVFGAQMSDQLKDTSFVSEVVGAYDVVSGDLATKRLTHDHSTRLAEQYARFMHPLAAGILAAHDGKAQLETGRKLERLPKVRQQLTKYVDSVNETKRSDAILDLRDTIVDTLIDKKLPERTVHIALGKRPDEEEANGGWILNETVETRIGMFNLYGNPTPYLIRRTHGYLLDIAGGISKYSGKLEKPSDSQIAGPHSPNLQRIVVSVPSDADRVFISDTYVQQKFVQDLADLVVRLDIELPSELAGAAA